MRRRRSPHAWRRVCSAPAACTPPRRCCWKQCACSVHACGAKCAQSARNTQHATRTHPHRVAVEQRRAVSPIDPSAVLLPPVACSAVACSATCSAVRRPVDPGRGAGGSCHTACTRHVHCTAPHAHSPAQRDVRQWQRLLLCLSVDQRAEPRIFVCPEGRSLGVGRRTVSGVGTHRRAAPKGSTEGQHRMLRHCGAERLRPCSGVCGAQPQLETPRPKAAGGGEGAATP